jgi:hypothetical protein
MSNPSISPRLAPPGAGLPWYELQIAKIGFGWLSRNSSREASLQKLEKEKAAILSLAGSCDPIQGSRRVLIERRRGMEDSSRFWSVFMTVDHLRIVNLAVAGAIRSLGRGNVPERAADTAAVKPDPAANQTVLKDFALSCDLIESCQAKVENLKTPCRYAHPWFGLLDASQWLYLAGMHMRLHRGQMEEIIRLEPLLDKD